MQLEIEGAKKPRPETAEKYWKVKELLKAGDHSIADACKEIGMARPTYQTFKNQYDPDPIIGKRRGPKPGPRAPKPQQFLDLPMHQEPVVDDKMVVVVCKASQLKNILDGIK